MTAGAGRPVASVLQVRGWLRVCTPLHVGGSAGDPNGELPVAVDGLDRVYVPGTGLAGAFAAWTAAHLPPEQPPAAGRHRPLWGYAQDRGRDGSASRAVVHDALLALGTALAADGSPAELLGAARLEPRTSVGIDRRTGSAAEGFLHTRLVVPRGAYLRLEFDVESTADQRAGDRRRVAALLDALEAGRIRLGAARTRGLGRVELLAAGLRIQERDLSTRDGLVAVLDGCETVLRRADLGAALPATDSTITVRIDWRPAGPTMVRASTDGIPADSVPLVSAVDPGTVRPVLPGSALKGVLRSRAEWIERTVRGLPAPRPEDPADPVSRRTAFRAQLNQPELRAVQGLFGTAAPAKDTPAKDTPANDEPPDDLGGLGAMAVDDCYATSGMDRAQWAAAVYGAGSLPDSSAWLAEHALTVAEHVAIDRWTGGAADGRLYSVLEPAELSWEPIRLTVARARLGASLDTAADAAVALLLLVLRDVHQGRVPVGYATNRGLGDIEVDRITLTGPDWPTGITLAELLAGDGAARFTGAWQAYLQREAR
jgi:CRISPR/Cas system CSM-associated protein Csm3 (group 7 of RAMP superfamily)